MKKCYRKQGFSLIELMIGVSVLAIAFLAYASLTITMKKTDQFIEEKALAHRVCSSMLEKLKRVSSAEGKWTTAKLYETYKGAGDACRNLDDDSLCWPENGKPTCEVCTAASKLTQWTTPKTPIINIKAEKYLKTDASLEDATYDDDELIDNLILVTVTVTWKTRIQNKKMTYQIKTIVRGKVPGTE